MMKYSRSSATPWPTKRRSIITCAAIPLFHCARCGEHARMHKIPQKEVFLAIEGDAWFDRNQSVLTDNNHADPVLQMLAEMRPYPDCVLEIGCSDGWRLNK